MKNEATPAKAWVLLIILAVIWGSSFILIKTGLKGLTAGQVGALRILSASVFLIPLALPNLKTINKKQFSLLLVVGLFGSLLPAFLFAIAQTRIPSSVAGILNAMTPLFTMLLGVMFFSQRLSWKILLGLLMGMAGTAFLIFTGSSDIGEINLYALLVVLATVCYGVNLNLIKFRIPDLSARVITSVSLLFTGPVTAIYLFGFTDFTLRLSHDNLWPVSAVIILGVIGTAVALILFNQLVKITTPVFTSSVTYLIPIVAVIWGLWDGETLQLQHLLGMLLIIAGVYLVNLRRRN